MVWVIVYIRLFSFIIKLFNFSINNVVRKSIIDMDLFNILKFVKEDTSREGW